VFIQAITIPVRIAVHVMFALTNYWQDVSESEAHIWLDDETDD
jgi:hypothetical protein